MDRKYRALLIRGPYPLVRGFLAGFFAGRGIDGEVFFCEQEKIEVSLEEEEGIAGKLAEWIGFRRDMATSLVVEDAVFESVLEAIDEEKGDLGLAVEASRTVRAASFEIRFETFSDEAGLEIKKLIDFHPKGVRLGDDFKMEEKRREEAAGVEGYAPEHDYELKGAGIVEGDVASIVHFRKMAIDNPLIHCETIKLTLE